MHQQSPALLAIRDLHLNVAENPVLRGLDLTLEPGSIHAIMGPNGSGKSSLAYCLARKPRYTPHAGSMQF